MASKSQDPDTGKFYEQRDPRTGNTIKGTGPKHLVRQIVRIRTSDGKEFLYSNGKVTGFDVMGEVATETVQTQKHGTVQDSLTTNNMTRKL